MEESPSKKKLEEYNREEIIKKNFHSIPLESNNNRKKKVDEFYTLDTLDDLLKRMGLTPQQSWRVPAQPTHESRRQAQLKPQSREEILEPFESVFFEPEFMDDLLVRVSIPQLLDKQVPIHPGVILYGPPGTGKSEFQRAVCEAYARAGAYSKQVSTSNLNTCLVGQFAKNLEDELQAGVEASRIRGLPSFLSFDEGSILAQSAGSGALSVSKHYQEAIDVFKRYLGNDFGRWLVVAISTNLLSQDFEDAMTREGRLTTFFVDYPTPTQISRMWNHFLKKYDVLQLQDGQAQTLAEMTEKECGALIEQFCRGYLSHRRQALLREKGYQTLLDALKKGENISEQDVRSLVNFDVVRNDVKEYLETREKRNGGNGNHIAIGFKAPKEE